MKSAATNVTPKVVSSTKKSKKEVKGDWVTIGLDGDERSRPVEDGWEYIKNDEIW